MLHVVHAWAKIEEDTVSLRQSLVRMRRSHMCAQQRARTFSNVVAGQRIVAVLDGRDLRLGSGQQAGGESHDSPQLTWKPGLLHARQSPLSVPRRLS